MPFLPDLLEDEEGAVQDQPVLSSTSNAPITGQSKPTDSKGTSSGQFSNIQKYLESNKPQSEGLAKGITENISQGLTGAKNSISQASSDLKSQAQDNTININESVLNQVSNDPINADVNAFSQMRDAQYKGPVINDYTEDEYKLNQGQQRLDLTKDEAGRSTLLKDVYNRPTYTKGEAKLDQVLLQNSDSARTEFDNVRNQWGGINDWLTGVKSSDAEAIQAAIDTTNNTKQTALNTLGYLDNPETTDIDEASGAFGSLQSSLRDRVNNFKNTDYYGQAVEDAKDRAVSKELFDLLGLENNQTLYGVKLEDFIKKNDYTPAEQDVASSEDVARYNALANLAGVDPTYLTGEGTYRPYDIDNKNLNQSIANAKESYENYYNLNEDPIQASINEMIALGNYFGGNTGPILTNTFSGVQNRDDLAKVYQDILDGNLRVGGLVYNDDYFKNFRGSDSILGRQRADRVKNAYNEIINYVGRLPDYGIDQQIIMEDN